MASNSQLISYLRDCYVSDNRELAVWDIFDKATTNLHVFEDEEELATGFFESVRLPEDYGTDMVKKTTLYAREKQLLYGCGLVTGTLTRGSWRKPKAIAAPLVVFDATIQATRGGHELRIDGSSGNVNAALLEALAGSPEFESEALDVSSGPITANHLLALIDQVCTYNPQVSGLALIGFPKILSKSSLETLYKESKLQSSPAAMLFLAQRSPRTRGVIHELDTLREKPDTSLAKPIRAVLNTSTTFPTPKSADCSPDRVPAILSSAQRKILQAAASCPLSLVIGPPGTGKSYTIASIAIERFIAGESVLIVAKNDQAIEVLAHKIEQELKVPDVVLRGGDPSQLKKMKDSVEAWLHGYGLESSSEFSSSQLNTELKAITQRLETVRSNYARRSKRLLDWGAKYAALDKGSGGFFFKLAEPLRRREILKANHQLITLLQEAYELEAEREALVSRLVKTVWKERLNHAVKNQRDHLNAFLKSLRSRSSGRQQELLENLDFRALLGVFPIWLCTLEGLHKILPLRSELFDLVLVDEATQCDIASSLPALQRGRRACVVGDPKQLRHVSFLSSSKELEIARANGISIEGQIPSFRKHSLLDLTDGRELPFRAVNLLDEHFRSRPELIDFSNREFYRSALKIMRDRSSLSQEGQSLVFERVKDGERLPNGTNPSEAAEVISQIKELVASEKKLTPLAKKSIGVLSPFRAQADHIAKLIESHLDVSDIVEHRLLVGTPYSFQGEERDVMIISLAIDKTSHPQAYRHAQRPDVFNVSITRAKDHQIVLHSIQSETLKSDSLLRKYLSSKPHTQKQGEPAVIRDPFLQDVTLALQEQGIGCYPDQSIAGMQVDLLCVSKRSGRTLALNLIGYPGIFEAAHGLASFLIFQRTGLEMLPVSYPLWRIDKEQILAQLYKRLG